MQDQEHALNMGLGRRYEDKRAFLTCLLSIESYRAEAKNRAMYGEYNDALEALEGLGAQLGMAKALLVKLGAKYKT